MEWSYVQGTADIPLRGITIGNLLQQQTEKTPDREAYVFPSAGIRKTFSQLLDEVIIFVIDISKKMSVLGLHVCYSVRSFIISSLKTEESRAGPFTNTLNDLRKKYLFEKI